MGADIEEKYTSLELSELASSGIFKLKINEKTPLTDAQLDYLVAEWESTLKSSSSINPNFEEDNKIINISEKSKRFEDSLRFSLKSESNVLNNIYNDSSVTKLRGSLENALEYISDKEGLTDDELKEQLNLINSQSNDFDQGWSDHLLKLKKSVASSMVIALDSASENEGMSSNEPKLKLLKSTSFSLSNDKFRYDIVSDKLKGRYRDDNETPLIGSIDASINYDESMNGSENRNLFCLFYFIFMIKK